MSEQAGQKQSPLADPEPVPSPAEDEAAAAETRSLLAGLTPLSPPLDLAAKVPQIIERRSRGRFFGRKKLHERIPFVWVSLVMLLVASLLYAVMRLSPALLSSP
ncbi:MAG TPA: hypothetical protein PKI49_10385 [Pseudomonadota bacterium]|jgi:hypothetical protein|nr:hypothetical protein [Pseudomonadota bacterium]HND09475.1 hypothetical protein [Pseudomonadota bacterium]HNF97327.1 hypothetical protein [Pseudomonadota bacterium]HNI59082.1 hypothetical protein [Pseudomonadota bacterium]HNK44164.1 hypothetical protein [Pseudomonadota bacterium]